jgi:hypothetical protein
MKTICYYSFLALLLFFASCKDETERLFDESAEQRAAEAVQNLKSELVAPANGWRLKYQPEDASGAYWLILHFDEDDKVVIESDLGANSGEFFMDTLTYRVDNSLGLELIFETYSFFSFLYEQDQATFLAEYEYLYVNKTSDGSLVFKSKSDPGVPTVIVMEEAQPNDPDLLGRDAATNIDIVSTDVGSLLFTAPAYQLTYQDEDLKLFLSLDPIRRTISFNSAAKKSTSNGATSVNFSTGYYLQGDSLILMEPLTGNFQGVNVSMESILLTKLVDGQADICGGKAVHFYEGITSQNDDVMLEATLASPAGEAFANFEFLVSPLEYIFDNGVGVADQISADITGAGSMQLYYDFDGFYALGFFIENDDLTTTFYLREFTPLRVGNRLVCDFAPTISVFGNANSPANIDNVNKYIIPLTEGGQTYFFEAAEDIFEMHNPCTGWSAAFFGVQ